MVDVDPFDVSNLTIDSGRAYLEKWLPAIWMVVNDKNGISSYEMARALGVTQKTSWFMEQRIRLALRLRTLEKLSGKVEADETFVGGKAKNMHKGRRQV